MTTTYLDVVIEQPPLYVDVAATGGPPGPQGPPGAGLGINVKDHGAMGDGSTDDTAAIQAVIDAAPTGSVIYFPRGQYMFSNLLLRAYHVYRGDGIGTQTTLIRIPGSTGTAIREKTIAEGNPSGGSGLWVRDMTIEGSGTTGDGLVLGDSVAAYALNYLAGVSNVYVRGFPSGTGIKITGNAVRGVDYVWSIGNAIGIWTSGQGNSFCNLWAEVNATTNVLISSQQSSYFYIQTEVGPQAVRIEGPQNTLFGVYAALSENVTGGVVRVASSAANCGIYGLAINPNGFTFDHAIAGYNGPGTGVQHYVPFWIDTASSRKAWIYDGTNGRASSIAGNEFIVDGGSVQQYLFKVGNSAAATTPGSVTKKLEIFDRSGVSLGFIPIYGAIT